MADVERAGAGLTTPAIARRPHLCIARTTSATSVGQNTTEAAIGPAAVPTATAATAACNQSAEERADSPRRRGRTTTTRTGLTAGPQRQCGGQRLAPARRPQRRRTGSPFVILLYGPSDEKELAVARAVVEAAYVAPGGAATDSAGRALGLPPVRAAPAAEGR